MRRKTHEQYVEELKSKNPNIEVVDNYINNATKILHRCLIDGHEWTVAPATTLQGHGCPICGGSIKKTHGQYVKELKEINKNIKVVDTYINIKTPILHKCLIDGHEWYATPNNILSGKGCPVCGGTIHRTHEQYVNELKLKNPSIITIEPYINNATKIMHKCLIHNYEWKISPHNTLNGCGCPECKKEKSKKILTYSHEKYIAKLLKVNENILVCETYVNAHIPILHKCLIDGHEWKVAPCSLLQGHGCPVCATMIAGGKRKKTHDQYIKELITINRDIEVLGEYIDAKTPILHRCKKDKHEWYVRPFSVLQGSGCPKCSTSRGEKIIEKWLNKNNIQYNHQKIFQDCKHIRPLPFDFYLLNYNICIEYQGKQHYEPIEYFGGQKPFENQVLRDNIKKQYCKEHNIILFTIPYFSNVYEELEKLHNIIIMKGVAA